MSTGRPKGKSKDPPCEISYNPTGRQFGCSQHQVFWAASERWPEPVELCPIGRMEKSLEDVWRIGNQRDQLRSYLSAFLAVHNGIKEVRDNATKYLKNGMSHSSGAAGKGTVSNTPPPLSATTQGANVGDGGLSGKSDPAEPRTATPEKAPEGSPTIRKVSILRGRAREAAEKTGAKGEDLVLMWWSVDEVRVERIVGDPVSWLLARMGLA